MPDPNETETPERTWTPLESNSGAESPDVDPFDYFAKRDGDS